MTGGRSDPEVMNDFMALMVTNLDTAFETAFNQIDQILTLHTVLRNHLERLRIKRNILNSQVEDAMLGNYNSDGYFYATSDHFASTVGVDFNYTTAFVDTQAGVLAIPSVSGKSRVLNPDAVSAMGYTFTGPDGKTYEPRLRGSLYDALDGLNNTAWVMEIWTNDPGPITASIRLNISNALSEARISKIDVTPFGTEPMQLGIDTSYSIAGTGQTVPFSNQIQTSVDKMVFVADQPRMNTNTIRLQATKHTHDYEINDASTNTKVYVFGFRDLLISEQYFDPEARFVSTPFSVPSELGSEAVIDAVSMTAVDHVPAGTSLEYYIAENNPAATQLSHYDWHRVQPLTDSEVLPSQIVRFGGTSPKSVMIRSAPRNGEEIELIQFNTTNPDPTRLNPTPSYFPELDVYRVATFTEEFLTATLALEEGVNTTRIYYTDLDQRGYSDTFNFWREQLDADDYEMTYGEIDTGHGFFYVADVGENGKSCYAETYVYADAESPVLLKECRKSDLNSRTWDVKIFLNGREIANLPVGTDKVTVPWKFKQGKNHIVMAANIPSVTSASYAPYIGSLDLMAGSQLDEYGTVKLDDWYYVDPYKFQYNLTNDAKAFTIYNEEIVSRKQPTNNFRLFYNQAEARAPDAIRVRVDLKRSDAFSYATPLIDQYRVRFAYTKHDVEVNS